MAETAVSITVRLADAEAIGMILLAAHDIVIQEGRYYERDGRESQFLAVIPKAALDTLRSALAAFDQGAAHA